MQVVVPLHYTTHKNYFVMVDCWGWVHRVSQTEERSCSIVWWYGSRYFCVFCGLCLGVGVFFWARADVSPHSCHWCSVDGYPRWVVLITCFRESSPGPCMNHASLGCLLLKFPYEVFSVLFFFFFKVISIPRSLKLESGVCLCLLFYEISSLVLLTRKFSGNVFLPHSWNCKIW